MKRSSERILTTHIGSLPRPKDLWALIDAKDRGQPYDAAALGMQLKSAVIAVVRKQAEVGIDIPSDGEQSKASFTNYVRERLSGLEGINTEMFPGPPSKFPYYDEAMRTRGPNLGARLGTMPLNIGPLGWKNKAELETDIANFQNALHELKFEEAFMPAVAVGQVFFMVPTKYYSSDRQYLYALADVLKDEYKAITDAGFVLQIDSPDFVMMRNRQYWNRTWEEYRKSIELRVEALNHALAGLPEDRIRFHVCWGNFEGPHENDVPLKDVVDLVLKVKAQSSADTTAPKFTGQYRDYETANDWFIARTFGPGQGRFQSVDPGNAGADPSNPQTWNAYAYVGNNPLTYTDPSGTMEFIGAGAEIGAAAGGPAGAVAGAIVGSILDLGALFYGLFGGGGGSPPPPNWANVQQTTASDNNPAQAGVFGNNLLQVDPTASATDVANYNGALIYLSRNGKMKKIINQLTKSTTTYTVQIIRDGMDGAGRTTVFWDPTSSLQTTAGGCQTAALGLGHELAHVAGDWAMRQRLKKIDAGPYQNQEEKRVITGAEAAAAKTLREPRRYDHAGTPKRAPASTTRACE